MAPSLMREDAVDVAMYHEGKSHQTTKVGSILLGKCIWTAIDGCGAGKTL